MFQIYKLSLSHYLTLLHTFKEQLNLLFLQAVPSLHSYAVAGLSVYLLSTTPFKRGQYGTPAMKEQPELLIRMQNIVQGPPLLLESLSS